MVLLYETKKDKGKGCIMKKIAKNPFLYLAMIFPKPAFDFTIQHQGRKALINIKVFGEGYNLQTERR